MKTFVLSLVFLLSVAVAQQPEPGTVVEERLRLIHIEPSQLAERLQLVLSNDIKVTADDKTDTLILRLPKMEGTDLERERQRLLAQHMIEALDRPQPEYEIGLYAIQPAMLSEGELNNLQSRLAKNPLDLPKGTTAKGMIYWSKQNAQDREILELEGKQGKISGQEITGNVKVRGEILPVTRRSNNLRCLLDLELVREVPGQEEPEVVPLRVGVSNITERPARVGTLPSTKENDKVIFYIWARPVEEEKK